MTLCICSILTRDIKLRCESGTTFMLRVISLDEIKRPNSSFWSKSPQISIIKAAGAHPGLPPPRHLWGSATWIHGPGLDCQHRLLLPETDRWKWPKLGSSPVCRLQFTENGWIFLATPLALFMLCIIRVIFQLFFVCTLNVTHSFLLDSSRQSLNRWRYTGLVGNLSFDPEMLIVWVSTSRSSPCFTSQRDWEIRGKIYKERKQAPL